VLTSDRRSPLTVIYEGAIAPGSNSGAKHHFLGIINALATMSDVTTIGIVPQFASDEVEMGPINPSVEVHHVHTTKRSLAGYLLYEAKKSLLLGKLRWRMRSDRPSGALVTRLSPFGLAAPFARILGWRVFLEVNGLPDAETSLRGFSALSVRIVSLMFDLQLRTAHGAICVTQGLSDAIESRSSLPTMLIENGASKDTAPIEYAQVPGDAHRIAYVGVTAPWRELDVVLTSLSELNRDTSDSPWYLDMIGDGDLTQQLKGLAQDLGISDYVDWHGWIDKEKIASLLVQARIGIVPVKPQGSKGACGSPLKLFEYLMMGRVIVGSDVDGIRDLDYPNLFTYRQGDSSDLASVIRRASSATPLSARQLELSRDRVDWSDRAQRVVAYISVGDSTAT
jgi:glycosyltransferase involved in cell wall biosynthesis